MKRARLRCEAVQVAAPTGEQVAGVFRAGRWRLNAGNRMLMCIEGLNKDDKGQEQPVGIILDLDTVQLPERMTALADHDEGRIVGTWENIKVENGYLAADLVLVDPIDDRGAAVLPDAVRAKALIAGRVPLQASVGASADYDELGDGETINGKAFAASGDGYPDFAARNAILGESSIVYRGADTETGQIAAKAANLPQKKETTMLDLKAIKAKYAGKSPEIRAAALDLATTDGATEASVSDAVHALELEAATAALTAANKRADDLQAAAVAKAKGGADTAEANRLPGAQLQAGGAAGAGAGGPKDWKEARKLVASENKHLRGMELNAAVSERFPALKAADCVPPGTIKGHTP